MEKVTFSNDHLAEMRQFYTEELDKTVKRLQHIKSVLEQIGGSSPNISIHISNGEFNKNKPVASLEQLEETAERVTRGKKRPGRKSMWETLILKRLRQIERPVTYDELTEEIMVFSKLPEEKRQSTKQAVVNVIFRLRNRNEKVETFSIGTREKYIALKQWLDENGTIRQEYKDRIKNPKRKVQYKKRKTTAKPKKA